MPSRAWLKILLFNTLKLWLTYECNCESVLVLVNCVTPQTVYVIKAIIALCLIAVALCLMAILLDVVVFSNRCMKAVRHHAILSILAGMYQVPMLGYF